MAKPNVVSGMSNRPHIAMIRNGKLFTTDGAEKIGTIDNDYVVGDKPCVVTRTLYRTPKGEFFETVEVWESDERVRADDTHLYDGHTGIIPIPFTGALEWAYTHGCGEAIERLEEMGVPGDDWGPVVLAEFRWGTFGEEGYIHHVIYKNNDRPGYMIASHDPGVSKYPQLLNVSVTETEGVKDFNEFMYVHELAEIEAKEWAEYHLPVDVYIKCFGPVEEA